MHLIFIFDEVINQFLRIFFGEVFPLQVSTFHKIIPSKFPFFFFKSIIYRPEFLSFTLGQVQAFGNEGYFQSL